MSNRWRSSGRYQLTKGVFNRFWTPKISLSAIFTPSIVKPEPEEGSVDQQNLLTEDNLVLQTESGFNLEIE